MNIVTEWEDLEDKVIEKMFLLFTDGTYALITADGNEYTPSGVEDILNRLMEDTDESDRPVNHTQG